MHIQIIFSQFRHESSYIRFISINIKAAILCNIAHHSIHVHSYGIIQIIELIKFHQECLLIQLKFLEYIKELENRRNNALLLASQFV